MTNTAYKTRKLLSMLSSAEKENDGLMLTHNLQNMQRNGKQTGCYGHIMNILNGKCVYVTTERSCYQPIADKNMVRYAADMKDYSSVSLGARGRNQFVTNDELFANRSKKRSIAMNRIIYTFFKTLAVLFVLFIFLSISALAQSFTLHNIALFVVSVICLNKCCGMMLAAKAERK